MSRYGGDLTQVAIITDWTLTDNLLVVKDGAVYRITGTLLASLVSSTATLTEKVETKTGSYTFTSGDNIIIADTDNSGSDQNFNLPAATNFWDSTEETSQLLTVKNSGSTYDVIVTPASSSIDGADAIIVGPGASAQIFTDGNNYWTRGI